MSILVIDAGGTIGSVQSGQGRLAPGSERPASDLVKKIAATRGVPISIMPLEQSPCHIADPLDSAAWGPSQWVALSDMIGRYVQSFDGVVVLHGTDTICHSAAALMLSLQRPSVPVILTGAMLSTGHPDSDAAANVDLALAAAQGKLGCLANEVAIAMAGQVMHGGFAAKHSASGKRAFSSPRMPTLRVTQSAENQRRIISRWARCHFVANCGPNANFSMHVIDIGLGPTAQHERLLHMVRQSGAGAVMFRCYPSGIAPSAVRLGELANRLAEARIWSIAVSSARAGRPGWNIYELGSDLAGSALIDALSITPESASVLLSWAVANKLGREEIAALVNRQTVAAG
jgi:L-asparaginase